MHVPAALLSSRVRISGPRWRSEDERLIPHTDGPEKNRVLAISFFPSGSPSDVDAEAETQRKEGRSLKLLSIDQESVPGRK